MKGLIWILNLTQKVLTAYARIGIKIIHVGFGDETTLFGSQCQSEDNYVLLN